MKSPKMPPNTCPLIDKVIDSIRKAIRYVEVAKRDPTLEGVCERVSWIDYHLDGLENRLEALRDANSQLRCCAEYWRDKSSELEDKVSELEDKLPS